MTEKKSHSVASIKYNKTHVRQIKMNLNIQTDADIIKRLDECGNIQGYIKRLIRNDINGGSKMENTVINMNGTKIDFDIAVNYMDNEIREYLHREIAPCTEQEFFTAYEKEHIKRFCEEWELSKENPVF